MAGTYAEQATLAVTNEFIDKVRVAMVKRGIEKYFATTAQEFGVLEQARNILRSGANDAPLIALLTVVGNTNIAAAAPVVPDDATVQAGVVVVLDALLK